MKKRIMLISLLIMVTTLRAAPTLVLNTVGQVADEVITSRTVQISAALEQAIYKKKGNILIPKLGTVAFKKEVSASLLEATVFMESRNFKLSEVSSAELKQAFLDAQNKLKRLKAWKALEVKPSEAKLAIERKLRAKKFIRFKADSSVVPVTNSEAREYFDKNRLKFGDLPFENFKENIKAYLSRQQVEQRLRDWFEVLQTKYKVKNVLSEI